MGVTLRNCSGWWKYSPYLRQGKKGGQISKTGASSRKQAMASGQIMHCSSSAACNSLGGTLLAMLNVFLDLNQLRLQPVSGPPQCSEQQTKM